MDKDALNYNPLAVESDGSCIYPQPPVATSPPPKKVKILPAPVKVEPIPEPPIAEIDIPTTPPPATRGGERRDGYSPGNIDTVFDALLEQDGRGKIGVGDAKQVIARGSRQQQSAIE